MYMNNIFYLLFHHLFHFHTVHYVRRGYFVQFTYSVRSRGKLRGQINVISYVLNSILSQKTCSFSCNEACPSPPPPHFISGKLESGTVRSLFNTQ